MKLNLFLKGDQEKAKKELDCYGYCLKQAISCKLRGDFHKAQMWHENVNRSLRELEIMKDNKIEMERIAEEMEIQRVNYAKVVKTYEKHKTY